jgi:hypothetical protein
MLVPLQFSHNLNHAIIYVRIAIGPTCRLQYFSISPNTPLKVAGVRALHVIIFLRSGVAAYGRMDADGQEIDGKEEPTCGGTGEVGDRQGTTTLRVQAAREAVRASRPPAGRRRRYHRWDLQILGHTSGSPGKAVRIVECVSRPLGEAVCVGNPRLQVAREVVRVGDPCL